MKSAGSVVALLIVALALGAAAYLYFRGPEPVAQKPTPPPVEVGVMELRRADVSLPLTYAGRVAGFRHVEVRAQVGGIILKREFVEGATVKQGDPLFRIDPRSYQAALDRADAQVLQARATLVQAEENFSRIEQLSQRQVATAKQLEDARAARDLARAALQSAQADVETAKLNIEFTTVVAPVSGPTSLSSPPEGALAQAQQTVLTSITQLDPAYVNFSLSESEFVELRGINQARDQPLKRSDIDVTLEFGGGARYPAKGQVNEAASIVDPRTGTLQIRAIFPNPDGVLLPNQFVRVRLRGVVLQDVFVVPEQAVSQGPQGSFVYVLNSSRDGVMQRPIRLDRQVEGGWAIRDGLEDGEVLVVDGLLRIHPGAKVTPVPVGGRTDRSARTEAAAPAGGASVRAK
ncbi:efflux RND transporter periplasmic adaptor subunit [Rhodopseudomonas sp. WA056]|uniref:efflux RND transporter periplasmic adaptor subunit n=1 Tax=Rhodopseudomonas sp. WA056 TaxID=2269367 RepID=UPI0013E0731B|nr:efflux RND transporter periplasmic adaptor subunit [Rhodopseudomonas sp. WA056]NEW86950.1 efflux RND transporter periplasmic adaptor subunit [Rhodopseudomonas sp. WA056]